MEQVVPWRLLIGAGGALALAALHASLRGMCRSPVEAVALVLRVSKSLASTLWRYVARGVRPEFPKWTLQFELLRAVMRTCCELYGDRMVADAQHARVLRAQCDALGYVLGWFYCHWYRRRVEAVKLKDLEHLWIRPADSLKTDAKRLVVMYVHGGAFSLMSPRFYSFFGATLAAAIDKELNIHGTSAHVDVFLANYHKAPEYCYPTQPEDVVGAYNYLIDHEGLAASRIILAGDSAGGGLVMSALLRLRDGNKAKLPLAAFVLCPFVDLSDSVDPQRVRHCILTRTIAKASRVAYHPTCADRSTWADASAVHCNLSGLPPVFIQAASLDYIFQDSERLAAKAKADGVDDWELDVHEGVAHVFSMFPSFVLPYASVGVRNMAAFAAQQFTKAQSG